jgi:hypothetical protein
MLALMNGADILRVHDVEEAVDTVMMFEAVRRGAVRPGAAPSAPPQPGEAPPTSPQPGADKG